MLGDISSSSIYLVFSAHHCHYYSSFVPLQCLTTPDNVSPAHGTDWLTESPHGHIGNSFILTKKPLFHATMPDELVNSDTMEWTDSMVMTQATIKGLMKLVVNFIVQSSPLQQAHI